jgi:hypothetical protein
MESFEFMSPTKFILQEDADKLCGQEVKKISDVCLFVHYGDDFTYKSGLYDRIVESLESAGVKYYELSGVEPNPKVSLVRKGIEICKAKNVGCILAAGGGSVIDTAKAVGIGAKYDGDVWDFYSKKAYPIETLPVGTVMTLPATGSEGSRGSVLRNTEKGESADVLSDLLRPIFTLMNPELTLTIPKHQTVYGIVDMFSHIMERYFSCSVDVNLTDYMCEGVMKSILVNSHALMKDLSDYNARTELMWSSVIAHNDLLGAGRKQDWATHMLGAQLSAQYNTVHGAALSVLFPCWAEYVFKDNIPRFVQFAHRVFNVEVDFYQPEKTALEGIRRLREFFLSMGAPGTLGEIGIENDEKFRKMAEDACRFGNIGGLKSLDADDAEQIYKMAQ